MPSDAPAGETQPLLSGQQHEHGENAGRQLGDVANAERATFSRTLGTPAAYSIVISIVIGSGIFTSPGAIDGNVPSPGMALVVWVVGGLLAWTGASTMAELGTAIPGEGGVQPYLRRIYGDVFGFLAAWTWIVAIMPATLAVLSIVFVESIFSAAGVTDEAGNLTHKLLSILILVLLNAANGISTKASTRLNSFFVCLKFFTILLVVVAGIAVLAVQGSHPDWDVGGGDWHKRGWFDYRTSVNPDGTKTHWADLSTWEILGHYSAALYGALWAYSGWDKAIYVSAELSAPARQLPLAINTAVPTIVVCYIAANAAYYLLLPWSVVSTTDSVAVTAITRLMGAGFGIVASILVCLVVAGSQLGNSFVAGRMAVAAANVNWFPRAFAVTGKLGGPAAKKPAATTTGAPPPESDGASQSSSSDAPLNALVLSTALSTLYILLGNFRALVTFNGLAEYSFFFLTVLGAIVLRVREPQLERPYRPFILVPVVFAVVSGFVVVRGAIFAPVLALVLVVLWAAGLLFYYARKWRGSRREED